MGDAGVVHESKGSICAAALTWLIWLDPDTAFHVETYGVDIGGLAVAERTRKGMR